MAENNGIILVNLSVNIYYCRLRVIFNLLLIKHIIFKLNSLAFLRNAENLTLNFYKVMVVVVRELSIIEREWEIDEI